VRGPFLAPAFKPCRVRREDLSEVVVPEGGLALADWLRLTDENCGADLAQLLRRAASDTAGQRRRSSASTWRSRWR
jgi:hypothetical protein